MNNTSTKDMVMQRVYKIHRVRALIHPIRFKVFLFCAGLVATTFSVSVPQVFENMFRRATVFGYFEYLGNAFIHTERFVQLACGLMLVAGVLYCRDMYFNMRNIVTRKF